MATKEKEQDQKEQEKLRAQRQTEDQERTERRQKTEGGEITSNGEFTKVIRDGHVEVIPTSEVYAKEPEDRIEGLEIEDRTVTAVRRDNLQDRLERKFHSAEDGDEVSARHATGPTSSGTTPREELEAEDTGEDLKDSDAPGDEDKDSKKESKKKGK
jgi:hypothetical protein